MIPKSPSFAVDVDDCCFNSSQRGSQGESRAQLISRSTGRSRTNRSPVTPKVSSSADSPIFSTPAPSSQQSTEAPAAASHWACERCTLLNEPSKMKCRVCNSRRPPLAKLDATPTPLRSEMKSGSHKRRPWSGSNGYNGHSANGRASSAALSFDTPVAVASLDSESSTLPPTLPASSPPTSLPEKPHLTPEVCRRLDDELMNSEFPLSPSPDRTKRLRSLGTPLKQDSGSKASLETTLENSDLPSFVDPENPWSAFNSPKAPDPPTPPAVSPSHPNNRTQQEKTAGSPDQPVQPEGCVDSSMEVEMEEAARTTPRRGRLGIGLRTKTPPTPAFLAKVEARKQRRVKWLDSSPDMVDETQATRRSVNSTCVNLRSPTVSDATSATPASSPCLGGRQSKEHCVVTTPDKRCRELSPRVSSGGIPPATADSGSQKSNFDASSATVSASVPVEGQGRQQLPPPSPSGAALDNDESMADQGVSVPVDSTVADKNMFEVEMGEVNEKSPVSNEPKEETVCGETITRKKSIEETTAVCVETDMPSSKKRSRVASSPSEDTAPEPKRRRKALSVTQSKAAPAPTTTPKAAIQAKTTTPKATPRTTPKDPPVSRSSGRRKASSTTPPETAPKHPSTPEVAGEDTALPKRMPRSGRKGAAAKGKTASATPRCTPKVQANSAAENAPKREDVGAPDNAPNGKANADRDSSSSPAAISTSGRSDSAQASNAKMVSASNRVLAFSSVHSDDAAVLMTAAGSLGGVRFRDHAAGKPSTLASTVTHLVTSDAPRRTVKILSAIAKGIWVIHQAWIYTSLERGMHWLDEGEFEVTSWPGPRSSRIAHEKGERGILDGKAVSLLGKPLAGIDNLKRLLQDVGATIVSNWKSSEICIFSGKRPAKASEYDTHFVAQEWLFDCIEKWTFLDPQSYASE
eukprot:Rmarinus@m.10456